MHNSQKNRTFAPKFVKLYFYTMKHIFLSLALAAISLSAWAVDRTYYSSVDGKKGDALFAELTSVTNRGYHSLSYDGLYTAYPKTDVYPADSVGKAGMLWDMYGGCTFSFANKCGSYNDECQCYNREHSIPQSWWGGGTGGIGCDIFHVIPTDGYVNNQRANYMFGEVASASYTYRGSKKGSSVSSILNERATIAAKQGTSTPASGTVFEPLDEFKGDFARAYFGVIMKWNESKKITTSNSFFSSSYTASGNYGLTNYGVALMMKWHREDPVSPKEITRNNAIQETQGNRNPFIDFPYLVEYIWGENAGQQVDLSQLIASFESDFVPGESSGLRVSTSPEIRVDNASLALGPVLIGGTDQATLVVKGKNLTGDINLSVSNTLFSASHTTIAKELAADGVSVTITYSPIITGSHSATLTLTSEDAEPVYVHLTGECSALCSVKWLCNGEIYLEGNPTTEVPENGRVSVLPTAPVPCDTTLTFVGWTADPIAAPVEKAPADLFLSADDAPVVVGEAVYYAVFAVRSGTGTATVDVLRSDFNSTGTEGSGSPITAVVNGVTTTFSLGFVSTNHIRSYAGGKLQISCGQPITEVRVGGLAGYKNKLSAYLKAEPAGLTFESDTMAVWTGKATSITFSNASQVRITSITVKAGGGVTYAGYRTSVVCQPTAIQSIDEKRPAARKFIRNGHLYINYDNKIYSIYGGR